jgi:hypothetical protein
MDFVSLLSAFGITPAHYPYVFLAILIIIGFVYIRISLGGTLSKVKDNVLVVITHLTTSNRGRLDSSLIRQMSPLQIQPNGRIVLADSGFTDLISNSANIAKFFAIIDAKRPMTKLDVESYAIYSFLDLMANNDAILNPVRIYLYQHPDIRETFSTLAGVDIRDRYLSVHPEITQ